MTGATRIWRIIFVVYAISLTTGTHWPALVLGPSGFAMLDKVLHVFAFAGLGFLLAMTGWIERTATLAVVLVAWAVLDELTQPLFNRHLTWTPDPPSVRLGRDIGAGLEEAVMACLAKDPGERPQGAGALLDLLDAADVPQWSAEEARVWWETRGRT